MVITALRITTVICVVVIVALALFRIETNAGDPAPVDGRTQSHGGGVGGRVIGQ
jgi:hypothetical protein